MALPFDSDSLECVYSMGVLHHVSDTARAVAEVYRILKPGGVFAVEIGWDQGPQVKALFEAEGFADVKIVKDLGDRDRVVTNGPDPRTNPIPQE